MLLSCYVLVYIIRTVRNNEVYDVIKGIYNMDHNKINIIKIDADTNFYKYLK